MSSYKMIDRLGLRIIDDPIAHIRWEDIKLVLDKHNKSMNAFDGITFFVDGPYPWDVEKVLEKLFHNMV